MLTSLALIFSLAAGIPPLDATQRVKLETTDQGSATVDEAAFYALVENARDWPAPGTVTTGDETVVLPDLAKIMAEPAAWQGRLVMLEGTLEAVMPEHKWSRSGFGDVEGLNLRVEGQPVILYLTDPPVLQRGGLKGREVAQKGAAVKVVARFFKLVEQGSEGGEVKLYPVFVGRQVLSMEQADAAPSGPLMGIMLPLGVAIAGCVFLLYYRLRGAGRRNRGGGMTIAEYHARKERQRPEEMQEPPPDLPDDPAAALDALSHDHRRAE